MSVSGTAPHAGTGHGDVRRDMPREVLPNVYSFARSRFKASQRQ